MPTITIPAKDLREGDELVLAGVPGYRVSAYVVKATALYLGRDGREAVATIYDLDPDTTITVDRPDPDAAVIEAMAKVLSDRDGYVWPDSNSDYYRGAARAALAAYRKHTESTMQAALDDHRREHTQA